MPSSQLFLDPRRAFAWSAPPGESAPPAAFSALRILPIEFAALDYLPSTMVPTGRAISALIASAPANPKSEGPKMASKNQRSLLMSEEEFTPESSKIGVCYLENLETF